MSVFPLATRTGYRYTCGTEKKTHVVGMFVHWLHTSGAILLFYERTQTFLLFCFSCICQKDVPSSRLIWEARCAHTHTDGMFQVPWNSPTMNYHPKQRRIARFRENKNAYTVRTTERNGKINNTVRLPRLRAQTFFAY